MQSVSLPLLLAAVLAGVVGGVIGGAVLGGAEGEAALPPRVDSASDPELAQRIADLEALQAAHAATLRAWAAGPPSESVQRQPEGDWVEREEFEALRKEVLTRLERLGSAPLMPPNQNGPRAPGAPLVSPVGPGGKAQTPEERIAGEVQAYGKWLGLDAVQAEQWKEAILLRNQRAQEMAQAWQAGSLDSAGIQQMKQQNAASFEAEVTRILTPEQLRIYRTKVGGGAK